MAKSRLLDGFETPTETVETPVTSDPRQAAVKASAALEVVKDVSQLNYEELTAEPKVPVTLAPQYRPYFGNNMPVRLNEIVIFVPVDGRTYPIPESFARIVHERRRKVDAFLMRTNRLADVQQNGESYVGELKF